MSASQSSNIPIIIGSITAISGVLVAILGFISNRYGIKVTRQSSFEDRLIGEKNKCQERLEEQIVLREEDAKQRRAIEAEYRILVSSLEKEIDELRIQNIELKYEVMSLRKG